MLLPPCSAGECPLWQPESILMQGQELPAWQSLQVQQLRMHIHENPDQDQKSLLLKSNIAVSDTLQDTSEFPFP